MNVRIRKYSWQLAPADIRKIRQSVFVQEQQVPPALEWDDTDEIADHFLVVLPDNTPVGVGRLFSTLEETAHIGRMAILPAHRGKGIGKILLRHMISEAAGQFSELQLSAQEHAIPFYQRSGFHVCSALYDDAGIPHVDMRCLAPQLVSDAFETRHNPMLLGEDPHTWLFSSESDMTGLMDSVVGQARQRLWLYDRLLDHDLYDRLRFRELVSSRDGKDMLHITYEELCDDTHGTLRRIEEKAAELDMPICRKGSVPESFPKQVIGPEHDADAAKIHQIIEENA